MKKIDLGQTFGILANIGVIAGIIFLAVEIDQSTKQASATAYQQRVNAIDVANSLLALSDDLPDIYVQINESELVSLTPTELFRVNRWEIARINRMEGQYYQYQQGFLDQMAYERMLGAASSVLPIWRELEILGPYAEFVGAIETYIDKAD